MQWLYTNRQERARWIAEKYHDYIGLRVLDVGGDQGKIEHYLSHTCFYLNIDVAGNPDVICDLDKSGIPFRTDSFDTVVCTDVLEHLEHLHYIFDELIRVSSRYVLVSLPNPWGGVKSLLLCGQGPSKFYGLPAEPPEDRHRWFFSYSQAAYFIKYRAERNGATLLELTGVDEEPASRRRWQWWLSHFLPNRLRKDMFSPGIWALIEKRKGVS